MYDVDKNGVVDLEKMENCVQAIYDMLGATTKKPTEAAKERAKDIFTRMDKDQDDIHSQLNHIYSTFFTIFPSYQLRNLNFINRGHAKTYLRYVYFK